VAFLATVRVNDPFTPAVLMTPGVTRVTLAWLDPLGRRLTAEADVTDVYPLPAEPRVKRMERIDDDDTDA
jgi:hypothetical protein